MALSEQIVASLTAHALSPTQERAVRACLQRDIASLLSYLPVNTHTECAQLETRTTTLSRVVGGLETNADLLLETSSNDEGGGGGGALVTLSDVEEALAAGAARQTLTYVEMQRTSVVWQATPKRCFQWSVRLRFNRGVFDEMVRSSAPAAAEAEPETPPPEPNQFAQLVRGVVDDDDAGDGDADESRMLLRRKRESLARTLVKRAADAEDQALEEIVKVSHEKAKKVATTTSSSSTPTRRSGAAHQEATKAFPKITVAAATRPRGGIEKRADGAPMKRARLRNNNNNNKKTTLAAAAEAEAPDAVDNDGEPMSSGGGGTLSRLFSRIFESAASTSNDPYVAQYATKPGLFHRVQKK